MSTVVGLTSPSAVVRDGAGRMTSFALGSLLFAVTWPGGRIAVASGGGRSASANRSGGAIVSLTLDPAPVGVARIAEAFDVSVCVDAVAVAVVDSDLTVVVGVGEVAVAVEPEVVDVAVCGEEVAVEVP